MKHHLLVLLAFCLPLSLVAGGDNFPIGARSAAIGHASVTLSDVWSVHHNQAGLAALTEASVGAFYENKFLINELSLRGGAFALPTKSGVFALSAMSFGFNLYTEGKYGLAYARQLSKRVAIGAKINYHTIRIGEGYGSTNGLTAEVGLLADITDDLTFGAHVFNPNQTRLADFDDERIPAIFRLGMSYTFSDKVFMTAEVEKDIDFRPVFKSGIEYHVADILYLRAGISTLPTLTSFGFGLEFSNFKLDIATSIHSVLGYTPQVSLVYNFKKNEPALAE